jgi:hypothetical protein
VQDEHVLIKLAPSKALLKSISLVLDTSRANLEPLNVPMRRLFLIFIVCCCLVKGTMTEAPFKLSFKAEIINLHNTEPELVFNILKQVSEKDLIGILQNDDTKVREIVYAYFRIVPLMKMVKVMNWMRKARLDDVVNANLFFEWIDQVLDTVSVRSNELQFNLWYPTMQHFFERAFEKSRPNLIAKFFSNVNEKASFAKFKTRVWDSPKHDVSLYNLPFLTHFVSNKSLQNDLRLNAVYRYLHTVKDSGAIRWIRHHYENRLWDDTALLPLKCVALIGTIYQQKNTSLAVNQLFVELGIGQCKWPRGFEWVQQQHENQIWDESKHIQSHKDNYQEAVSMLSNRNWESPEPFEVSEHLIFFNVDYSKSAMRYTLWNDSLDLARELIVPGSTLVYSDVTQLFPSVLLDYTFYQSKESKINPAMMRMIIDAGVDPNIPNRHGITPLFYCKNILCAKTLLASGADLNVIDQGGQTPLFEAIRRRNVEVVQFLLDQGIDTSLETSTPPLKTIARWIKIAKNEESDPNSERIRSLESIANILETHEARKNRRGSA